MKTSLVQFSIVGIVAAALFSVNGCYTVLMSPSDLTASDGDDSIPEYSQGDYTSDVSYNQNCLSCHSQAELDDRYYDMQSVGMVTAHGMSVDPYGWRTPATSVPWWYDVIAPVPPTAAASVSSSGAAQSGPRQRTTGSTRGSDGRTRPPSGSVDASAPAPASGATATAPAPASATATAPSAPPAPTETSNSRSRTNAPPPPSTDSRTRKP